jgi:hypothetical protein
LGPEGQVGRHTFYKNSEMAGYCAVIHALQLKGIDGHYGNQRKALIFSFGADCGRRAINIDKGVIQKADILEFQNRHLDYPHAVI